MLCYRTTRVFFQFQFLQFKINLGQSAVISKLESYSYYFFAWLHWFLDIPLKPEQQQQKQQELAAVQKPYAEPVGYLLPLPIAPDARPHCRPELVPLLV